MSRHSNVSSLNQGSPRGDAGWKLLVSSLQINYTRCGLWCLTALISSSHKLRPLQIAFMFHSSMLFCLFFFLSFVPDGYFFLGPFQGLEWNSSRKFSWPQGYNSNKILNSTHDASWRNIGISFLGDCHAFSLLSNYAQVCIYLVSYVVGLNLSFLLWSCNPRVLPVYDSHCDLSLRRGLVVGLQNRNTRRGSSHQLEWERSLCSFLRDDEF